jgi:hypothetical protein
MQNLRILYIYLQAVLLLSLSFSIRSFTYPSLIRIQKIKDYGIVCFLDCYFIFCTIY